MMSPIDTSTPEAPPTVGARDQLLAGLPVTQRRLQLAGVSTAVLEGGAGAPMILLHGPGGNATHWMRVIPDLVTTHRVVVPDLPGQGESPLTEADLTGDRVLTWLGELVEQTCAAPPILVGFALGGAIAARFASSVPDGTLAGVVLVDSLGLVPFDPAPQFGFALHEFLGRPNDDTHDRLWQHCASDLDRLRGDMGAHWPAFQAYNVERIQTPSVQASLEVLMAEMGGPPIPADGLVRITTPTALIWGRHDLATPLTIAEAASARHAWPLYVIEDCGDDPPMEAPDAFVRTLRTALDRTGQERTAR